MIVTFALLLGSAVVIYLACEFFVNGVEWVGHRFGVSRTAVGTVLAAFPGKRRRRGTEPASAPIVEHARRRDRNDDRARDDGERGVDIEPLEPVGADARLGRRPGLADA